MAAQTLQTLRSELHQTLVQLLKLLDLHQQL